MEQNYEILTKDPLDQDIGLVKMWTKGVPVEETARVQLKNVSRMPFIHKHVAVMPDCHWGNGACVGSVIPTVGAIIPAAVGVDLGCGMIAHKTSLKASDLPDNLSAIRSLIEKYVPHGRTDNGGVNDRGAWRHCPPQVLAVWGNELGPKFDAIVDKFPKVKTSNNVRHLGTLGTGNHFIEICLDKGEPCDECKLGKVVLHDRDCREPNVWFMLHSGSRGVGGSIGNFFIEKAKREMEKWFINLPDINLAYLSEDSKYFDDYIKAVGWAQEFAASNRKIMMSNVIRAVGEVLKRPFDSELVAVNCHHNYISKEHHFGKDVWVTRKGAVRARKDDLGIIPGSMGARSFIIKGKGNNESFHSCSHGAGRKMSRTEAKRKFSLQDHIEATKGIECRKDADVIDETPMAYKDIDQVMNAQTDLVEVLYELRQIICVKG